ncbi:hypothetical protein B4119_2972 [Parageobacillus caldoxylosilyticus]|uniref:Uncharacterized protein n=1 Tax=Saccharococcus caldoxylosilyticus TaxID=81408 RepID=A0A150LSE4_9BACL|nr:hypothetical protein B4119_2972 [Parageobacillus caldoxylosilyticus]
MPESLFYFLFMITKNVKKQLTEFTKLFIFIINKSYRLTMN